MLQLRVSFGSSTYFSLSRRIEDRLAIFNPHVGAEMIQRLGRGDASLGSSWSIIFVYIKGDFLIAKSSSASPLYTSFASICSTFHLVYILHLKRFPYFSVLVRSHGVEQALRPRAGAYGSRISPSMALSLRCPSFTTRRSPFPRRRPRA
jgi:hypothetical protein